MKILHIDTSICDQTSVSRLLSREAVKRLVDKYVDASITYRDLVMQPLPHLGSDKSHCLPPSATIATDRTALEEFIEADVVVIGVAFYNLSIPSQLKAWIDRIIVSGRTFRYTDLGVEGLAARKRIILLVARGGVYRDGTFLTSSEHAESYLRSVFAFIGVTDLEVFTAEGLALGKENRDLAINSALAQIRTLCSPIA